MYCFFLFCVHISLQSGAGRVTIDSMLNDDSREAEVVLRGRVNGTEFEVERAVKVGCLNPVIVLMCLHPIIVLTC